MAVDEQAEHSRQSLLVAAEVLVGSNPVATRKQAEDNLDRIVAAEVGSIPAVAVGNLGVGHTVAGDSLGAVDHMLVADPSVVDNPNVADCLAVDNPVVADRTVAADHLAVDIPVVAGHTEVVEA